MYRLLIRCLYRYGELTRGMLVVDRREDETAYTPGANRAMVQAELDRQKQGNPSEIDKKEDMPQDVVFPAEVFTEYEHQHPTNIKGVPCVAHTPGPNALLELLLSRVWGC